MFTTDNYRRANKQCISLTIFHIIFEQPGKLQALKLRRILCP